MSNFVNQAVLGKVIGQNDFLEELTKNPIVKLFIFIGSVAIAGYFTIKFGKELWSVVFVPKYTTETFKTS